MSRRCALLAAAAATLLCLLIPSSAGAYLYWNNGGCCRPDTPSIGTIARANNDGTNVNESFIHPPNNSTNLQSLAVGPSDIYWVDAQAGWVGHSGIDGSNANNTYIQDSRTTAALAADSQYVFWTNSSQGAMYRANPDGTGKITFLTGLGTVPGMTDVLGKLYWGSGATLYTSPTTTASRSTLLTVPAPSGGATPNLLYVAVGNGFIYWSDAANNTIGRASLANLSGTVNDRFITGASDPQGVAVDARYIYWSNSGQGGTATDRNTIGRANVDGTGVNQRFITGASIPYGLQVDNGGVFDLTAPIVTPSVSSAPASTGWYNATSADPTVSFAVSDPDSIISSTTGCDPTTVSSDTAGTSFTCTATSAGGSASAVSATIKRDKTAPTLNVPSSTLTVAPTDTNGAAVNYASQVSSSDATSGIASSSCAPASGTTFGLGRTTVSCTATDVAGNSTTKSFTVLVKDPNMDPTLIGDWTFSNSANGGELTGNWGSFEMKGGATITNGLLNVDGQPNANVNAATAWARGLNYTGPNVSSKTMIAWVQMDSTSVRGGAPVALYKPTQTTPYGSPDVFDAVDYGEITPAHWFAGSDNSHRIGPWPGPPAQPFSQDFADTNVGAGSMREIAISYKDNGNGTETITGCLNGVTLGSYTTGNSVTFNSNENPLALFGPRHLSGGSNGTPLGAIQAHIDEARIYNRAMSCTQAVSAKDASTTLPNTLAGAGTLQAESFVNSASVSGGSAATAAGGTQLQFSATGVGSTMTLPFSVTTAGTYELLEALAKAPNGGMYTISIDGQQIGGTIDSYAASSTLTTADLGPVTLAAGAHTITITIVGKNPSSSGYNALLDSFSLGTDSTPPLVTSSISGTPNAAGWYSSLTGDPTVSWAVSDPDSRVTSTTGCSPTTVNTDTAGVTYTCSATSLGGTTSSTSTTLMRDATAPVLSVPSAPVVATATGSAGAAVDYTVSSSDNLSGVQPITCSQASGATYPLGDTLVTCTTTDVAGNKTTASFTVRVQDTVAPKTIDDAPTTWSNNDVAVHLTATDGESGVASTHYRVDDGADNVGTVVTIPAPADHSGDGTHTIHYRSIDNAGNAEDVHDATVKIDTRAPAVTTSHGSGASGWNVTSPVAVKASADDGVGSGAGPVACVDNGKDVTTDGVSGEGDHDVTCSSTDAAGNTGTAVEHVKIDTVAPATTDDAPSATTWANHDVTVTAAPSDATSGVEATYMKVDGGDYAPVDSIIVPASIGDGPHTVSYYSVDKAGNAEAAHSVTVNIDTTAPKTTDDAPAGWTPNATTVHLHGTDADSGVASTQYRVDGGDVQDGDVVTIPAPADHSNDGSHTIHYRSIDKAGNPEDTHDTVVKIDTTAPAFGTVDVPAKTEATGPTGAPVVYRVPVSDGGGSGAGPVSCSTDGRDSHSGDTFPIGTTKVTCRSTDGVGLTSTESFDVIVVDTTAPDLTVPAVAPTEATGASGAAVHFDAPTATDVVDGAVAPDCSRHSGDTFAIGTTTVTCTATDAHHNTANKSFDVTVRDTTAPVVTAPADQVVEATGPTGAKITFANATATDVVDGSPAAPCSPTSGSTFALGTTTVTCSSTDAHGNTGQATFKVTVRDTTKPTLSVPDVTYAEATGGNSTAVKIDATATDIVDGSPAVTCTPASGSTFSLGSTAITCSATDAAGNKVTKSASVMVYRWASDSHGAFVISDKQAVQGASVTFWSSQWEKANPFSSGLTATSSFKGYIEPPTGSAAPKIGGTWTSGNANSVAPPSSVPAYMAVVVASKESKGGSTIGGDVKRIAIVKTASGYANDPGHAGTGTVVGVIG
jgi:hypothetical protein